MFSLRISFLLLVSSVSFCLSQDTNEYGTDYCYQHYWTENSSNIYSIEVDGSDYCQFNCYDGATRLTDNINVSDMTSCPFGVCFRGQCVEESDVKPCVKSLRPEQTLASFETEECEIRCLDTKGYQTNISRSDYSYCVLNVDGDHAQEGDNFPIYGYCFEKTCLHFPEPSDEYNGENNQEQNEEEGDRRQSQENDHSEEDNSQDEEESREK